MTRLGIRRADVLETIDYLERSLAKALDERKRDEDDERQGYGYPRMCGRLQGAIEHAVDKLRKAAGP